MGKNDIVTPGQSRAGTVDHAVFADPAGADHQYQTAALPAHHDIRLSWHQAAGRSAAATIGRYCARRSEERRVGKERDGTCRSRWQPLHQQKNKNYKNLTILSYTILYNNAIHITIT